MIHLLPNGHPHFAEPNIIFYSVVCLQNNYRSAVISSPTSVRRCICFLFCFGLIGIPSPPHPRASAVAGVVETLRGVGKEFRTAFLNVEKLAVRAVGAPWSKRTPLVGADIHPLACAGKKLIAINEQVPECAVRCVAAPCHPAPAAVLRTFHTVLLHIDTHEFPAQVYYLWHNIIIFRLNIPFALPRPADISGTPCPRILHNVSATEGGEREKERQAHHLSPELYVHKQE